MSLVSDLLALADRLLQVVNKQDASDRAVFQDAIDPLFTDLNVVVQDLHSLYRPITRMLANVDTSGGDSDVRGQYDMIVETFRKRRANSRVARISADAAAVALIEHFDARTDEFAKRVTQLAARVRTIVGRAHTDPLDDQFPTTEDDSGDCPSCTVSAEVAMFLDDLHEDFSLGPNCAVTPPAAAEPQSMSREQSAAIVTNESNRVEHEVEQRLTKYSADAQQDYYRLRSAVSGITKRINAAWEDAAYIYSMIRLSILSGND